MYIYVKATLLLGLLRMISLHFMAKIFLAKIDKIDGRNYVWR
jgi:hypothetical protein